jgi:hypothetical protein
LSLQAAPADYRDTLPWRVVSILGLGTAEWEGGPFSKAARSTTSRFEGKAKCSFSPMPHALFSQIGKSHPIHLFAPAQIAKNHKAPEHPDVEPRIAGHKHK